MTDAEMPDRVCALLLLCAGPLSDAEILRRVLPTAALAFALRDRITPRQAVERLREHVPSDEEWVARVRPALERDRYQLLTDPLGRMQAG